MSTLGTLASSLLVLGSVLKGSVGEAFLAALAVTGKYQVGLLTRCACAWVISLTTLGNPYRRCTRLQIRSSANCICIGLLVGHMDGLLSAG